MNFSSRFYQQIRLQDLLWFRFQRHEWEIYTGWESKTYRYRIKRFQMANTIIITVLFVVYNTLRLVVLGMTSSLKCVWCALVTFWRNAKKKPSALLRLMWFLVILSISKMSSFVLQHFTLFVVSSYQYIENTPLPSHSTSFRSFFFSLHFSFVSYKFVCYCQQSIKYFKLIIFREYVGCNQWSYDATNIALRHECVTLIHTLHAIEIVHLG